MDRNYRTNREKNCSWHYYDCDCDCNDDTPKLNKNRFTSPFELRPVPDYSLPATIADDDRDY